MAGAVSEDGFGCGRAFGKATAGAGSAGQQEAASLPCGNIIGALLSPRHVGQLKILRRLVLRSMLASGANNAEPETGCAKAGAAATGVSKRLSFGKRIGDWADRDPEIHLASFAGAA